MTEADIMGDEITPGRTATLNLRGGIAVDIHGVEGKIVTMYDGNGEETEDPEEARTVVIEWSDGDGFDAVTVMPGDLEGETVQ